MSIDPHGIQSSKTTGEPPLVLANSVFFAIKQAVAEARKEVGLSGSFTFDAPATVQRIQQACGFKPTNIVQSFRCSVELSDVGSELIKEEGVSDEMEAKESEGSQSNNLRN